MSAEEQAVLEQLQTAVATIATLPIRAQFSALRYEALRAVVAYHRLENPSKELWENLKDTLYKQLKNLLHQLTLVNPPRPKRMIRRWIEQTSHDLGKVAHDLYTGMHIMLAKHADLLLAQPISLWCLQIQWWVEKDKLKKTIKSSRSLALQERFAFFCDTIGSLLYKMDAYALKEYSHDNPDMYARELAEQKESFEPFRKHIHYMLRRMLKESTSLATPSLLDTPPSWLILWQQTIPSSLTHLPEAALLYESGSAILSMRRDTTF